MTTDIDWKSPERTDAELPAVRVVPDLPGGFDLWSECCRKLHNLPDGWMAWNFNCSKDVCPDGFVLMNGGFLRTMKRGGTTTRGRDKSGDRTVFAKLEDLRAFEHNRLIAFGVCPACRGEGRIKTKASVKPENNRYRPCKRCGGSGEP